MPKLLCIGYIRYTGGTPRRSVLPRRATISPEVVFEGAGGVGVAVFGENSERPYIPRSAIISPEGPTGTRSKAETITRLLQRLAGRSCVDRSSHCDDEGVS